MLGEDDLSGPRGKLAFMDPGALGVGDAYLGRGPREAGFRAPDYRRVELLCFESGHLPNLDLKPQGRHIYEGREFTLTRLPIEPAKYVVLELALSEDVVNALPNDATLTLSGPPGGPQERVLSRGARDAGLCSTVSTGSIRAWP